jgi:ankyrin repeat protein
MVWLVLQKATKADLVKKNKRGNTPLHLAMAIATLGVRQTIATMLIEKGEALGVQTLFNEQNNTGETPFQAAIATGDRALVMDLLQKYRKKIDLSLRNQDFKDASQIAQQLGYRDLVIEIEKRK